MREAIKLQIIHDTMAIYKEKKKGEKEIDPPGEISRWWIAKWSSLIHLRFDRLF